MSEKRHGLSKEEIAKQFMLPERKSKIATLLKQDGQAYCICRSSDSSRFMIGCDACEEWYHGDCINITAKEAKHIKQFFCIRCREEDPTLEIRYKVKKTERTEKTDKDDRKHKKYKEKEKSLKYEYDVGWDPTTNSSKSFKKCGQCSGCLRTENCGRCDACRHIKRHGTSVRLKLSCDLRSCRILDPIKPSKITSRNIKLNKKRKRDSSNERLDYLEPPRHCYGPSCTKQSRPGSKYCSEDCGMKLATSRIFQVLPQRLQEWALTPCIAEQNNKIALDNVRGQQQNVKRILQELDKKHVELDKNVERAKNAPIDPKADIDDNDDTEMSMYCITCGHEINSKTAIKHMEKCFNKYESQSSFGSIYKSRIEGQTLFCDYYNPINSTYCKRLRVLCPEHCKDPKVNDSEVCGCPLAINVFDVTQEFCRAPKKNCVKHYMWEKLRRAEIDMERVRQWLKMDELIEQERQIRTNMASRAGVLALLLHSTYNHKIMEQIAREQDMEQRKLMEEELQRYSMQLQLEQNKGQ